MIVEDLKKFNLEFVEKKEYEKYITSKYPNKKIAILSCMDTRLTELLPAALGIKNGDVKIIKNAGGVISHPFGSVVKSLLIAILKLGVTDIMVIGHTDCGVQNTDKDELLELMIERGISKENIDMAKYLGIDFDKWLSGFECVEQSVTNTVNTIINHPLIPKDTNVYGFVMDSYTGKLNTISEIIRKI